MKFSRLLVAAIPVVAALSLAVSADVVPPSPLPGRPEGDVVALTGGAVFRGDGSVLPEATILIRGRRIAAVGRRLPVPPAAEVIEMRGLRIFPGLIDALAERASSSSAARREKDQPTALRADTRAADLPPPSEVEVARWRDAGVLAVQVAPDIGVFRGQTVVVLMSSADPERVVRAPVAMNLSLRGLAYRNRVAGMGEVGGEFPTRFIGVMGFLRQTLLDARYLEESAASDAALPSDLDQPGTRQALEALRPVARGALPLIFPAREDREVRRALDMSAELGVTPILAGGYEAAGLLPALKARRVPVLVSLNFPEPDRDSHPEFRTPIRVLRHWQKAPASAAQLAQGGVRIAFSSDGLSTGADFVRNLRRAVNAGLPAETALRAVTLGAAEILGVERDLGSIEPGKLANLVVAEGDLLREGSRVKEVFVAGQRHVVPAAATDAASAGAAASVPLPSGLEDPFVTPRDLGRVVVVKNANVMTVSNGTLREASLLIRDGKIAAVGRDIVPPPGATVVDGSGKWITPGFIDLHVHNGTDSHNESGALITSMVDTRDTLNPEEIGVYRTLAAGVTTANTLHGSVNIIGGRTVVVKNKWGRPAAEMIFPGAKPGLKFAVKEGAPRRTASPPSTLMGVEALLRDAFSRARAYEREWTAYGSAVTNQSPTAPRPRRDLRLEALVEVMRGTRLLHVHCYWAEEMALVMRVAEEFGFKVRVLHHAQEAFKVAPEIARHGGGGASIFTDLLAETRYSAAILTRNGVLTSINSDGWKQARHLNQDVGRLMKFGDLSEDEALALITLNPAKQLQIDARVGSIEVGKDADLVVFNRYPLSVYAVPEMVFIDGRVFFSQEAEHERERRTRAALARVSEARAKAGANGQ